jgi:anti-sigma factor RsiW
MNDADLQELLDKVMAGRLSPDEKRRWNALLAERPELEEEVALAEALRILPGPPPVSSNFTSLVMQEVRRTQMESTRPERRPWFPLLRLLRVGATVAVATVLVFTVVQRREGKQAREAAETIAASVQAVTYSPDAETENALAVFRDFEAIRQLPPNTPGLDDKFLSALAK